jgi:hypothetical protein
VEAGELLGEHGDYKCCSNNNIMDESQMSKMSIIKSRSKSHLKEMEVSRRIVFKSLCFF